MPHIAKLKIEKNTATIEEGEDSLLGKLIAGCTGKIRINTPFGSRAIKTIKRASGAIIRRESK